MNAMDSDAEMYMNLLLTMMVMNLLLTMMVKKNCYQEWLSHK